MKSTDDYLQLVTSQHRTSPKYMAFLEKLLTPFLDTQTCMDALIDAVDLDQAVGAQLDIAGQIIGLKRTVPFDPSYGESPKMDDPTYRIALKMKVGLNTWKGRSEQIYDIWANILPDIGISITDNQDMTLDIALTGNINSLLLDMIHRNIIFPRPQGVFQNFYYNGVLLSNIGPYFGYGLNTTTIKGYGEGKWNGT